MILHNLASIDCELGPPSYLFQTKSNTTEFVVITEEMEELNEFCFHADLAAIALIKKAEKLRVVDPATGEADEGWTEFLRHSEGLRWTAVQEVLVAGMIFGLLFTFTEKSLKWLCEQLGPSETAFKNHRVRGPKLEGYLSYLQTECRLHFSIPSAFEEATRVARPIRNKFTHGDWEEFSENDVDLSKVFSAVSSLFATIEKAYIAR